MPNANDTPERSPFPVWLKDLCYVGGLIVALVIFGQNLKSDQRSSREQLDRVAADLGNMSKDVQAIRNQLPNPEVLNLRFKGIEEKIVELKGTVDFEAAKSQKLREQLARKGWIE
jgi:hypothetical protein